MWKLFNKAQKHIFVVWTKTKQNFKAQIQYLFSLPAARNHNAICIIKHIFVATKYTYRQLEIMFKIKRIHNTVVSGTANAYPAKTQ